MYPGSSLNPVKPGNGIKNIWGEEYQQQPNKRSFFAVCSLQNPSGSAEGIMNSHANLSLIKHLAKRSVSRNDETHTQQSHFVSSFPKVKNHGQLGRFNFFSTIFFRVSVERAGISPAHLTGKTSISFCK